MRTILFLAYKDMLRDIKIAVLVVSLLAFSYINLTFFPAFLNGLSNTFQAQVIDTTTSHILIEPSVESSDVYLNFESSIRKKIDLIPGVAGSSPHIATTGTIFSGSKQIGARIEALTPSEDEDVTTIHQKIVKGEFLSDTDADKVVLGEMIAGRKIEDKIGRERFGVTFTEGLGGIDAGEKVRIKFSNGVEKEYKVKGIVSSQFGVVSLSVYMNKKDLDNILGTKDQASSILVRLNDKSEAERYKKLILELGIPNANIKTWEEASSFAQGINETFGIVILVTTLVAVIIVISTIGIVVFINVARKRRIIGVLKALGMQNRDVMLVFLTESVIFGIIGTLLGLAIVSSSIFYLNSNPIQMPLGDLRPALPAETAASSIIILIASSVVAGYIPARMASRQNILETIRVVE